VKKGAVTYPEQGDNIVAIKKNLNTRCSNLPAAGFTRYLEEDFQKGL